ncbi:ECF transporter S component [Mycoplasmatota bacterium WC44]
MSSNITTKNLMMAALFIAIVTSLTFIQLFSTPNGGLVHAGYIALFPIAVVFGKNYGAIAGAIGMALFDILSGWASWAPATFVVVGLVGYFTGLIANGGKNRNINILALTVGSLISITGYFIYNAFFMKFGVESALVSASGDAIKVFVSLVVAVLVIPSVSRMKDQINL